MVELFSNPLERKPGPLHGVIDPRQTVYVVINHARGFLGGQEWTMGSVRKHILFMLTRLIMSALDNASLAQSVTKVSTLRHGSEVS